jgi:hypothetical protein
MVVAVVAAVVVVVVVVVVEEEEEEEDVAAAAAAALGGGACSRGNPADGGINAAGYLLLNMPLMSLVFAAAVRADFDDFDFRLISILSFLIF